MKRIALWGQIFLVLFFLTCPYLAKAEEFCVRDAQSFQDALVKAATNGEDDVIKVIKGTYTDDYDSFGFNSSEGHNLEILGGYEVGCTVRTLDPANSIIDGQHAHRALILKNSDGGDIKVEGFTIKNGAVDAQGGGLLVQSSSPTHSGNILVNRNIVTNNTATDYGGGIFAYSEANPEGTAGSVTITENVVTANKAKGSQHASGGGIHAVSYSFEGNSGMVVVNRNEVVGNTSNFGAGVYATSYGPKGPGDVTISGNRVTDNVGNNGNGGGIYAGSDAVTAASGMVSVVSNIILHNTSNGTNNTGMGGGIYAYTSSATTGDSGKIMVNGNIIKDNRGEFGAGVYAESSTRTGLAGELDFKGNWISENQAISGGGGIVAMSFTVSGTAADTVLTDNILAGNNAGTSQSGGGLWVRSVTSSGKTGHLALAHNTITGNRGACGVLIYLDGNTADIYNNIIWGNLSACAGAAVHDMDVGGMGTLNGFNNNISGGTFDWTASGGNIDQDPFFVSPGHWDEQGLPADSSDDLWVEGDYHLRNGSPCIDMGHSTPPRMPATDRDGNPREMMAKADMGAYEYATCFPVSPELDISIPCAQYAGVGYAFTLNYYPNPNDSNGFYWELNAGTFNQVTSSNPCLPIQQDLSFPISCAHFLGKPYSFTLDFCKNSKTSNGGLLWNMDASTFKAKEAMP